MPVVPGAIRNEGRALFAYTIPEFAEPNSFCQALEKLCPGCIYAREGTALVLREQPASSPVWSARAAIDELLNPADIIAA